ncbi:MAG: HTH-type transcriptional regulator IscR [Alphaproteobacteria bacterium MarineAlpha8_Bin1]|nr:MAG: HTH-type transcriptional regulator IscR [Alphaproteobacteria bacterium MarineAlpha8_Bin1]|tara:strand:- start:1305 stop:1787 length:483 start_codon:yes stop_codon:yes gene_type:complete
MRLTSKGRFAVTALVDLAIQTDIINKPVSISSIAYRQNISINFLEQIFRMLKKRRIIKSVRGSSGGYLFNRDPSNVTIYDVIIATEEKMKITQCNEENFGCIDHNKKIKCLTHDLWSDLTKHILLFLESVSISDIKRKNLKSSLFNKNNDVYYHKVESLR